MLGANVEVPSMLTITKDVTFDLNGFEITREQNKTVFFVNNAAATLTIKGDGTVRSGIGAVFAWYGKVIIEGGTFVGVDNGGELDNGVIYGDKNCDIEINGGTFIAEEFAVRTQGHARVTINDGTFTSDLETVRACEESVVTINGGTFSAGVGYDVLCAEVCQHCPNSTGGTITDNR